MTDFRIDFLENYDRDSIIEELKRIASVAGIETITKNEIKKYGRVSYSAIWKRFGSLRKALQEADLITQRYTKGTEDELLSMLIELWETTLKEEGRRPYRRDQKKFGFPISDDTYVRRFGSWKKALLAAYESVSIPLESELTETVADGTTEIPSKRSRESLSLRKRFFVMKRDHFACILCGAAGYGVKLEVDHIVPFAKGGTDALDNLRTLCFRCNRGKRDSLG